MHLGIRSLSALALGLALACTGANAQLLLSGSTTGSFDDLAEANTTVMKSADGSTAKFYTGIPTPGSTQSKIEFTHVAFNNVASGEPIQIGLFTFKNGITYLGTGAPEARFEIGIKLTSPVAEMVAVSVINFHIDHTPNTAGAVPDTFSVSFNQPSPISINNTLVQFKVNVEPREFQIAENATMQKGDITVTFTPVPEPSTYAAWGAALLVGFIAWRRVRSGLTNAVTPIAA